MTTSVEKTVDTLVQSFQTFQEENQKELCAIKSEVERHQQPREHKTNILRPAKSMATGDEMRDNPEYKAAFQSYVRNGDEAEIRMCETKTATTLNDENGGFAIPQQMVSKLEQDLGDVSVMRRLCQIMSVSSSSVELLLNAKDANAGWTGEIDDRVETDSPELRKLVVHVHELYAKPRASQKLLDDAAINVESWLTGSISSRLAELENHAFLFGDGVNKPKGILSYQTGDESSWGTFKHVTYDDDHLLDNLVDMFAGIKGEHLNGSCWLMSRATLAHLRKLRDQDGRHIWQPSLDAKTPSLLLGYPVELCDDMPALGSGEAPSVIFGNFSKAYQIVDRQGVSILRDPFSAKPHVEFYTTKRVGGDVVNFDALTMLVSEHENQAEEFDE